MSRYTRKRRRQKGGIISPLLQAVIDNNPAKVDELIARGVDLNQTNNVGETPVYAASQKGYLDILGRLIAAGADINQAKTDNGATPLFIACYNKHIEIVKKLIEAGADINKAKTDTGVTPLYIASLNNYMEILKVLIEAGADVNKPRTGTGATPLYNACFYGYIEIVKVLIEAGADINQVKTDDGATPLYIAGANNNIEIVKVLIETGADLNKPRTDNGATPLHRACEKNNIEIVKLLVNAGVDINKEDTKGHTPLFNACKSNNIEIVKLLINADADVNKKSYSSGMTPLYVAAYNGFTEVAKILLDAGADTNLRLKTTNETPMDIAKKMGHAEIVELIEKSVRQTKTRMEKLWSGWTQADASKLDGIFGDAETAKNFALCPVCMKYVIRADACMYMSHNCSTERGYFHKDLYNKYKNIFGNIHWCTICGRICNGHQHYNLGPAQSSPPTTIPSTNPFAEDCKVEGGGGIDEKLVRFRRLREYARDLQTHKLGVVSETEAMNQLCEEMWNAPLFRIFSLNTMKSEKAFNIPHSEFPTTNPVIFVKNAPNVPFRGRLPVVHATETDKFKNALFIDDKHIIQFKHYKQDATLNTHDKPGQQISREAFLVWLASILENPMSEAFGKCWQYKTSSQLAPLGNAEKALVCDATLHPEEVKAALDLTDPAQAALAESYRKAFNSVM